MVSKYNVDYLKVTSMNEDQSIKESNLGFVLGAHSDIIHRNNYSEEIDQRVFGFFKEIYRTHDWVILFFRAFSVDLGIKEDNTAYKTRGEALDAAVQYLHDNGFQAKPFDLEGMIDNI